MISQAQSLRTSRRVRTPCSNIRVRGCTQSHAQNVDNFVDKKMKKNIHRIKILCIFAS